MEDTCLKTDKPMVWNNPAQSTRVLVHSKGCAIQYLFPSKFGNRDVEETCTFKDVDNATDLNLLENSHFI